MNINKNAEEITVNVPSYATQESAVPAPLILSVKQVAQLLGCDISSVYRSLYTGKLRKVKGFSRIKISRRELERFVNEVEPYNPKA